MPLALLLDAPSLIYRAFFALPKTIADPDGRPVNAVRGFLEMTTRLLVDRRPDELIATFDDDWRPAFRVAAFAGYKAERPEDPPELPHQFDVIAEVLDAAGVPRALAAGLEADDVLATLCGSIVGDQRAEIVTGDRDLTALVRDPHVALLFPVRGVSELIRVDEAQASAKYGVSASRYEEFAMLRGDPSDGLPGVAGIGPVRAAKLLEVYGSVDGILTHVDELPPKQRTAFEAAADYLRAMKRVVPMVRDAPVEQTEAHAPDVDALQALAERHGLGSSPVRLGQALRRER
ncbi:MAG TPA: 5'-3' exonuclease [Actinomycetota bacterium]|nr:5'-3' exonuclease [Actinomycetota bacterium]